MEFDSNFNTKFNKIFNNINISEVDDPTPEVLEDTYLNMEFAMPRDNEGPRVFYGHKILRNANGIPIVTPNDNLLLDTCICEVECTDGYKASLAANIIAIYICLLRLTMRVTYMLYLTV